MQYVERKLQTNKLLVFELATTAVMYFVHKLLSANRLDVMPFCRSNTLDRNPGLSSHSAHSSRQNTGDLLHLQHPIEVEILLSEGYHLDAVTKALQIVDSNIEKARKILEMFILKT